MVVNAKNTNIQTYPQAVHNVANEPRLTSEIINNDIKLYAKLCGACWKYCINTSKKVDILRLKELGKAVWKISNLQTKRNSKYDSLFNDVLCLDRQAICFPFISKSAHLSITHNIFT